MELSVNLTVNHTLYCNCQAFHLRVKIFMLAVAGCSICKLRNMGGSDNDTMCIKSSGLRDILSSFSPTYCYQSILNSSRSIGCLLTFCIRSYIASCSNFFWNGEGRRILNAINLVRYWICSIAGLPSHLNSIRPATQNLGIDGYRRRLIR